MKVIKHLLICLIAITNCVVQAKEWQILNFQTQNIGNGFKISIEKLVSPLLENELNQINYHCVDANNIYPIHQCNHAEIEFIYDKTPYKYQLNGWINLAHSRWNIQLFNKKKTLSFYIDSNNKNKITIDINEMSVKEFNQLTKQFTSFEFENIDANITAQININMEKQLAINIDYSLENLNWESADELYVLADSILKGEINLNQVDNDITINATTAIKNGEGLFKDIYVSFDQTPIDIDTRIIIDENFNNKKSLFTLQSTEDMKFNINVKDWQSMQVAIDFNIKNLTTFYQRFLASYFEILGIEDLEVVGKTQGLIKLNNGELNHLHAKIDEMYLAIDSKKIEIDNLSSQIKWNNTGEFQPSIFTWDSLLLAGMPVNESTLDILATGDQLKLPSNSIFPIFDGSIIIKDLNIADIFKPDISIEFNGEVTPISLKLITGKMGWPLMTGSIEGKIPAMKKTGQTITFDGSLDLKIFDGIMQINNLSIERLFGIAPVIAGDLSFKNLNLQQLTSTYDFGEITGLINGYVKELRITNWKADRLDAHVESVKSKKVKQTISQRAIDNISSIGGIQGALSRSFLRFFDYFKYKNIGIGCRLRNSICEMSGINGTNSTNNTYKLIEGKGIPSINIIGFRKFIDWEIFLDRLLNAGY